MYSILIRYYQGGKSYQNFDFDSFTNSLYKKIENLTASDELEKLVVIVNCDQKSGFAEIVDKKNDSPTKKALLSKVTNPEKIHIHQSTDWGLNRGSATALNEGISYLKRTDSEWYIVLSTEIEVDNTRIKKAIEFAEVNKLKAVGLLRKKWWERPQWNMLQNTAAIWHRSNFINRDIFHPICNGTGERISIGNNKKALLAGMEDFHFLLHKTKVNPEYKWGMFSKDNPISWENDFNQDITRRSAFTEKIERQYEVMKKWSSMIFPTLGFEDVMNHLYRNYHIG